MKIQIIYLFVAEKNKSFMKFRSQLKKSFNQKIHPSDNV